MPASSPFSIRLDSPNRDAHRLGHLTLGQPASLTHLGQTMRTHLREQP